jgi:hypothetical protein
MLIVACVVIFRTLHRGIQAYLGTWAACKFKSRDRLFGPCGHQANL